MRISEVADRTGVPATTLRFYETVGLLPAARTSAGYRDYDDDALERLAVIAAAKRLGLTLADIAEVLGVWSTGSCARTTAELTPRLLARLADVEREASALMSRAQALNGAITHLAALPESDEPCGPDCSLPAEPAGIAIACSLDAGDHARRLQHWRAVLRDASRVPLPGGVRLGVPAGRVAELAALAAAEQSCCPFLDLRIDFAGSSAYLEVRAPHDATELIAEVFAPA
jgi:DNA-binding transcriptional MerR regulator